jgi:hypothetical protein
MALAELDLSPFQIPAKGPGGLIDIGAVAAHMGVTRETVRTWCYDGFRGRVRGRAPIRLRSVRVGKKTFTTQPWIDNLIRELNPEKGAKAAGGAA